MPPVPARTSRARAPRWGPAAPVVDKLRVFHDHPGFVEANADRRARGAGDAARRLAGRRRASRSPRTASRWPWRRAPTTSRSSGRRAAWWRRRCRTSPWALVYQSRSGSPQAAVARAGHPRPPRRSRAEGAADVVVAPVGFVSDHMEVVYDLDTEARERAAALGLGFVRAGTAGTHPAFVRMVRELVEERVAGGERRALGARGPRADRLRPGLLRLGRRPARDAVAARRLRIRGPGARRGATRPATPERARRRRGASSRAAVRQRAAAPRG